MFGAKLVGTRTLVHVYSKLTTVVNNIPYVKVHRYFFKLPSFILASFPRLSMLGSLTNNTENDGVIEEKDVLTTCGSISSRRQCS